MTVQAEVSLYPLRTKEISPTLDSFIETIKTDAIVVETGAMSSRITGDIAEMFLALASGFAAVAKDQEVVLIIKVSNACPVESRMP